MISLQIKNIRQFMTQFLAGDAFDSFLLEEATISTYNIFTKGKRTPTAFHFVLHLIPEYMASLLEKGETAVTPDQVKAFVLNIKYDGAALKLITGTAFHTFLMDRTPDTLWDNAVRQFLTKRQIDYEES